MHHVEALLQTASWLSLLLLASNMVAALSVFCFSLIPGLNDADSCKRTNGRRVAYYHAHADLGAIQ